MYTPASLYARTQFVQLNQPPLSEVMLENIGVDSTALGRKGRLYLLCDSDSNLGLPLAFARSYYGSPVFDVLPALEAAYVDASVDADEYGDGRVLAALVLQGLDIHILAADDADIYLIREGVVVRPLQELHTRRVMLDTFVKGARQTVRLVRARALMGEQIIMARSNLADGLSGKEIVGRIHGNSVQLARRVAQLGAVDGRESPVTLIRLPSITPTADIEHGDRVSTVPRPKQDVDQGSRRGTSPVTIVAIVAVIIIAAALLIKRPSISDEQLQRVINWVLTPAPVETPLATGTPEIDPTPTIEYVTPSALD